MTHLLVLPVQLVNVEVVHVQAQLLLTEFTGRDGLQVRA